MSGPGHDVLARTSRIINGMRTREAPLLEILHAVQHELGHIPEDAQRLIASELNLSRAEVHGVVTFYHDFRDAPAGRHRLRICRAEACQSMGGEANAKRASELLGLDFGQTSSDGSVTLEAVYCLGLCALAPAAMLDGNPVGRVDAEQIAELVAEART